ncbi:MAG TPA: LysM peptidoglycan-binding domain-containing protein [Anaerolineaceae bacterium]|nr:LysM peptidoglycan-binding domain-containing protein [Anaerolineaceae bacterium]
MRSRRVITSLFLLLAAAVLLLSSALFSTPAAAQVLYFTPTADASGAIYYVVKQGDTCDSIALVNNIPVDTLRNQNALDFDQCRFLQIGQKLLLGTVPTAVITPGPSPTPTSILPTPEPIKGFGVICIYLYNDINGNAMAEEVETLDTGIAGGQVSITHQRGEYSNVGTTLSTGEALCFNDIPEGEYSISIAIPEGYNPTSSQNVNVLLKAGDTSTINFSAQVSGSAGSPGESGEEGGSVLIAVIGGLILLAGVGVGLYARYILRK